MKIRHTNMSDLPIVMDFIHQAQNYFKEHGIDQWQDGYPNNESILLDIEKNHSYVLEDHGIIASMYFAIEDDPCYKEIDGQWLTHTAYAIIHRIVVSEKHKGKNIASYLLQYAIDQCTHKNIQSIRIDTHQDNLSMQKFLSKHGFEYCGIITLESGAKRLAFEKILNK